MSNCNANVGSQHEYAMSAPGASVGTYSQRFTAESFGLKQTTQTEQDNASNGTIWNHEGDEVVVAAQVSGAIVTNPKPDEMLTFLKNILGGSETGGVVTPGPQCNYFQISHYDKNQQAEWQYRNCVTASAQLSASDTARLLKLNWNVEGQSKNKASKSTGNLGGLSELQPFQLREAVLTLNSANIRLKQVTVGIENNVAADGYYNSLTRTEMPSMNQVFTLTHETPWDRTGYAPSLGEILTAAATLVFTSQGYTLTFDFPVLKTATDEPAINGRDRVHNTYTWRAKAAFTTGTAAAPMTVTLETP